jgi:hypothetical protein
MPLAAQCLYSNIIYNIVKTFFTTIAIITITMSNPQIWRILHSYRPMSKHSHRPVGCNNSHYFIVSLRFGRVFLQFMVLHHLQFILLSCTIVAKRYSKCNLLVLDRMKSNLNIRQHFYLFFFPYTHTPSRGKNPRILIIKCRRSQNPRIAASKSDVSFQKPGLLPGYFQKCTSLRGFCFLYGGYVSE